LQQLFNSLGTAFASADHNKEFTNSQKRFIEDLNNTKAKKDIEI
jgi:hypothetical protein